MRKLGRVLAHSAQDSLAEDAVEGVLKADLADHLGVLQEGRDLAGPRS